MVRRCFSFSFWERSVFEHILYMQSWSHQAGFGTRCSPDSNKCVIEKFISQNENRMECCEQIGNGVLLVTT